MMPANLWQILWRLVWPARRYVGPDHAATSARISAETKLASTARLAQETREALSGNKDGNEKNENGGKDLG